ncbi:MAG TPA: putative lipid II flippase FtsW [Solirubrobacteraceae bacterium]|nr:putative lipid II flippase FtsW [Solirubrobacteraceae bacterium]
MARQTRTQSTEQRILLTATLCLLAYGAVMVYSASSATSVLEGGSGTSYLVKFILFGGVGLAIMALASRRGIELIPRISGPLLVLAFVLVLAVHIPHIGVSVNGGRRWVGAGPLIFEPAELMKLALILYSATLIAKRPARVMSIKELARPLLLVCGAGAALVASEPDIGSAMVIVATIFAMLLAAGIPLSHLGRIAGALALVVLLYALAQPYARARLTSFLNPWAHAAGSGFQEVQAQIAVGNGGIFGVGPGQSVQKAFYLPEAPTDFIVAVIGEELGVVGLCALLSLYGMIAYAGLRTARKARSLYSAMIAVGCCALILSQALLNVFAVLGLAPLTGVPLPFVSYGASSLIVMCCASGLLQAVAGGASAHVRALPDRRPRQRSPHRLAAGAGGVGRGAGARAAGTAGARAQRSARARSA